MQSSKKDINFFCRSTFPAAPSAPVFFSSSQVPVALPVANSNLSFTGPRCQERGCVFPLASASSRRCRYHESQQAEPQLFRSHQPSWAVMERGRFGLPDSYGEPDPHSRDRRRLAELWERFQSDDSA